MLDDDIQFIRNYAKNSKAVAEIKLGWHVDRVRIQLGLAQVVNPDDYEPEEMRLVHCMHSCAPYGHFHFILK
jgi:hypothetical protein